MCPMMIIYFQSFLQRSISFSLYVWVYLSMRYNQTWVYNAWQNTINVCTRRKTVFVVAIWEYKYLAIQSVKTQESEILNPHHVAVHFWKVLVSINYEMHDTVTTLHYIWLQIIKLDYTPPLKMLSHLSRYEIVYLINIEWSCIYFFLKYLSLNLICYLECQIKVVVLRMLRHL